MANNLISCDETAEKIYVHSGISSTISDSFASQTGAGRGLGYDGANLISSIYATADKIYLHSGVSSTITDSFSTPGAACMGLTYDGANLVSCDANASKIYLHSGISSTITDSFSSLGADSRDLTYDGANLVSCRGGDGDRIYVHNGISSSVTDSFASPGTNVCGLAYDGANLVSCDYSSDQVYLHSGISSTITDSFATPSGKPTGLTYELVSNNAPTAPTSLEVDGKSTPTGANCVTSTPLFTAIFNDPDAGDISNAIEIEVGTASGLSDMWDSGWLADTTVDGNRCSAKTYAGAALSQETSYWWRCRFRDDDDAEGAWSAWQQFDVCAAEEEEVGLLECAPGGPLPKRCPFRCMVALPRRVPVWIY